MKFNLKEKVTLLVEVHRSNNEQCIAEMLKVCDKWKEPETINKYNWDFYVSAFQDELNQTMLESVKADTVLNQKLKMTLTEYKDIILNFAVSNKNKPSDYAAQINNALQFLAIEGDELTDERAFTILKPFMDDYDQMGLFANVVEKQIGFYKLINSFGNCNFEKTFGKYNRVKAILNLFNEAEAIAENIFVFPKVNAQRVIINNHQFYTKQDGYLEMASKDNILNLLDSIEKIIAEIPELNFEQ